MKNVPQLRFKGFNDEWHEKYLKNEVTFFSGLTYSPNNIIDQEHGTLVIRSSNVVNGNLVTDNVNNIYVDTKVVNSEFIHLGDIVVVVRNGSRRLIGKHALVNKKIPNTVIGAFMTGIRAKNYYFINALLNTRSFKKSIHKNLGATINQITIGNFKNIKFTFPGIKEQQKIGAFFSKLDDLITKQAHKVELLKQLKHGYLQKLFPQAGQTTPQLRFKGFNDEWQNIKLENFVKSTGGRPLESEFSTNGKYKVISIGSFNELNHYNDQNLRVNLTPKTAKAILNKDDLTMILNDKTLQGNIIGRVLLIDKSNTYVYNQRVERLQLDLLKYNAYYVYYLLNFYRKNIIQKAQGATQIYVNWSDIKNISYYFPCYKEQQKIGVFFAKLDHLIELQNRKLALLQELKKGYLQKMFV